MKKNKNNRFPTIRYILNHNSMAEATVWLLLIYFVIVFILLVFFIVSKFSYIIKFSKINDIFLILLIILSIISIIFSIVMYIIRYVQSLKESIYKLNQRVNNCKIVIKFQRKELKNSHNLYKHF